MNISVLSSVYHSEGYQNGQVPNLCSRLFKKVKHFTMWHQIKWSNGSRMCGTIINTPFTIYKFIGKDLWLEKLLLWFSRVKGLIIRQQDAILPALFVTSCTTARICYPRCQKLQTEIGRTCRRLFDFQIVRIKFTEGIPLNRLDIIWCFISKVRCTALKYVALLQTHQVF